MCDGKESQVGGELCIGEIADSRKLRGGCPSEAAAGSPHAAFPAVAGSKRTGVQTWVVLGVHRRAGGSGSALNHLASRSMPLAAQRLKPFSFRREPAPKQLPTTHARLANNNSGPLRAPRLVLIVGRLAINGSSRDRGCEDRSKHPRCVGVRVTLPNSQDGSEGTGTPSCLGAGRQ